MKNRLTHKQWCRKYDVEKMSGRGSGCSFSTLLGWTEPSWKYQEKHIKSLEAQVKLLMEMGGFYDNEDNWYTSEIQNDLCEVWDHDNQCYWIGGNKARETMTKVKEMRDEKR